MLKCLVTTSSGRNFNHSFLAQNQQQYATINNQLQIWTNWPSPSVTMTDPLTILRKPVYYLFFDQALPSEIVTLNSLLSFSSLDLFLKKLGELSCKWLFLKSERFKLFQLDLDIYLLTLCPTIFLLIQFLYPFNWTTANKYTNTVNHTNKWLFRSTRHEHQGFNISYTIYINQLLVLRTDFHCWRFYREKLWKAEAVTIDR